jgi:chromosome segregation ATPase
VLTDLANANKQAKTLSDKLLERNDECIELRTIKQDNESKINGLNERIGQLEREAKVKASQLRDVEARCSRAVEESEAQRKRLHELNKELTELKLKVDVQLSQIDGHKAEIAHLNLELRETKDLYKIYEDKCDSLIKQLTEVNAELNDNKRVLIGYN